VGSATSGSGKRGFQGRTILWTTQDNEAWTNIAGVGGERGEKEGSKKKRQMAPHNFVERNLTCGEEGEVV